jgi:hypothetical protein
MSSYERHFAITDDEGSVLVHNDSDDDVQNEDIVIVYGFFIKKENDNDDILSIRDACKL